MKAIETIALTKYYGKSRGVADISLSVEEGDFFGFIGPNGAGKSTTIRTLLGLISPTGGNARIFGTDITGNREQILGQIGYMPSEANFYRTMRVKDVIKLSARFRKKDCSAEAGSLCDRLALDTEKRIDQLSLGNRKKVSIVCALQHNPRLCILDEPTSGLDPLMQREFYSILQEHNARGTTIFLSSHVLSEVQRYCRHAAVIREGRLLLSDSIEKLSHTETKRVTLRGIHTPPALDHMKDIRITDDTVRFLYGGKPEILLKTLAPLPLTDITITEPDLEEIFMHYYQEEETSHDTVEA
ncbi:MAG: ABC transporter ATP-binding protein [Eubacteriales bacterium]|nr:ABC transporter ATP-binding protein [Eubacteriales bacterium]